MCLQSLWGKSAINAREKIERESFLASNAIKEPSATIVYRQGVLSFLFILFISEFYKPLVERVRGTNDVSCILRYSEISLEEVEKVCPACRGLCDCKSCLRSDNTIKVWSRVIIKIQTSATYFGV